MYRPLQWVHNMILPRGPKLQTLYAGSPSDDARDTERWAKRFKTREPRGIEETFTSGRETGREVRASEV